MERRTLGLISGIGLTLLLAAPVVTQAIAYGERPAPRVATVLAEAYHVSLESAWPQLASTADCRNGGDEMLRGMVARNAEGVYQGTLDRNTMLYFCGAHGPQGKACELVLEGDGSVAVEGFVVSDETSPSGRALRLTWAPKPDHAAQVQGACSAGFKRSVREMYLTVRHAAEFPLPVAGEGLREQLENYAWTVEVQ